MKIAVFSDIHADINKLKYALSMVKKDGIDKIYHAGDVVGYGKDPNEVVALLRKEKIEGVLGNFDEAVGFDLPSCGCHAKTPAAKRKAREALKDAKKQTTERNKAGIRLLPEEIRLKKYGKRILIVHATVFAIAQYVYENTEEEIFRDIIEASGADIIICGHTHAPYYKIIDNVHIVNAGSITCPRRSDKEPTYVVLEITRKIKVKFRSLDQESRATLHNK